MNRTATSTALPQRSTSPSLKPLMANYDQEDDEGDLSVPRSPLSWDQLRRQARQIENEIELKLASLSKLGATVATPSLSSDGLPMSTVGRPSQEVETEELLKKLQTVILDMTRFIEQPSTNPSMLHLLDRHKDILRDYLKEFRRIKANIKAAQDKANLMNQVQDEIRIFNAGNGDTGDYYLSERNRIEGTHRMTDMILEQAYATRQDIWHQGRVLRSINARVSGVLGRIPGINNLISRINTRRKRDSLIMAGVISTCIMLILLYWLHT